MNFFSAFLCAGRAAAHVALRIKHAANHVIANAGKIFHAPAADHYLRVFLQVVSHTRNVRGHFHSILQPDTRYLSKRRIWFLRRHRVHARTRSRRLRTILQRRRLGLVLFRLAAIAHKLVNRRQTLSPYVASPVRIRRCIYKEAHTQLSASRRTPSHASVSNTPEDLPKALRLERLYVPAQVSLADNSPRVYQTPKGMSSGLRPGIIPLRNGDLDGLRTGLFDPPGGRKGTRLSGAAARGSTDGRDAPTGPAGNRTRPREARNALRPVPSSYIYTV